MNRCEDHPAGGETVVLSRFSAVKITGLFVASMVGFLAAFGFLRDDILHPVRDWDRNPAFEYPAVAIAGLFCIVSLAALIMRGLKGGVAVYVQGDSLRLTQLIGESRINIAEIAAVRPFYPGLLIVDTTNGRRKYINAGVTDLSSSETLGRLRAILNDRMRATPSTP